MKYKVTKKDFYRAYLLHIKPRKIYSILGIVLICIFLFAILLSALSMGDEPADFKFAIIMFLCLIVIISVIYISPLYTVHKVYKQTKGVDDELDLAAHEESFSVSGRNFNITIPYKDIYKIRSNDSYLLIYMNQYFYTILPKTNNDLINAADAIEEKFTTITSAQDNKTGNR